jgi:Ca2+-binding RTX toxin-like protein
LVFGDDLLGGDRGDPGSGLSEDNLSSGDGNDVLLGGPGNDLLRGDAGDDYVDGGAGTDEVDYSRAEQIDNAEDVAGVTVDLTTGEASGEGADTLRGIENVNGSDGKDTLRIQTVIWLRGE